MTKQMSLVFGAVVLIGASGASADLIAAPQTDSAQANSAQNVWFTYGQTSGSGHLLTAAARGTISSTETYTARLLGQTTTSAFFFNSPTAIYTFDGLPESAGTHAATQVALSVTESLSPLTNPNEYEIVAQLSSDDSSDLLPNGIIGAGLPIDQIRFDVGAGLSGSGTLSPNDPITYTSSDTHAYLFDAGVRVFVDGVNVFEASFGDPPVSSAGSIDLSFSWNLNGAVGVGVDAVQTYWRVRDVPAPGSAALLSVGLVFGIRRRRR